MRCDVHLEEVTELSVLQYCVLFYNGTQLYEHFLISQIHQPLILLGLPSASLSVVITVLYIG